ncbi:NAD(P)H-binding protein [Streptomyces sp. YS415]|uniref:NAD(P)H-binding protein n=1 Tax=Streptomyces sp. YS415 TaxID=2944806 RepID=UPI0020214C23|nr:NAD(P)H-binding protein [Streptomyces sp. YS415]MCL7430168.1 NAD(P)H-binding protein [Streptomyces sp. YS415]
MITVTGATGNVGSRIVQRLRATGHEVRAVVGPGETFAFAPGGGLEVVEADFSDAKAVQRAVEGADAYFLMSPPSERQVEWQRIQVTAAAKAGVGRVVKLSAYDTGADSEWNMGRWHWDGELALRESGLPHAVLRPQYFQQNLLLDQAALRSGKLLTYIPDGRPVGMVDAADIADTAAVLLTTEPLTGQIVVPTGPATITTQDAADAISSVLGIGIEIDYVDTDRAWSELRAAGRPDWWIADLLNICQKSSAEVNDDVPTLTGHAARTIKDSAASDLAAR